MDAAQLRLSSADERLKEHAKFIKVCVSTYLCIGAEEQYDMNSFFQYMCIYTYILLSRSGDVPAAGHLPPGSTRSVVTRV